MSTTSLADRGKPVRKRISCAAALTSFAFVFAAASPCMAKNDDHDSNAFEITTLSTQPHLVTAGDVLVRVDAPNHVALQSVAIPLNGVDVTSKFVADANSQSLTGLVTGLKL